MKEGMDYAASEKIVLCFPYGIGDMVMQMFGLDCSPDLFATRRNFSLHDRRTELYLQTGSGAGFVVYSKSPQVG
ncbi:MAG: hypothetical protein ACRD1R_19825 [Acidobacteriota bacterium]